MSTPPLNRRTRLLTGTTPVFEVQPPARAECPQDSAGAAPAASTPSPQSREGAALAAVPSSKTGDEGQASSTLRTESGVARATSGTEEAPVSTDLLERDACGVAHQTSTTLVGGQGAQAQNEGADSASQVRKGTSTTGHAPARCDGCGAPMRQVAQLRRVECSAECGRAGYWVPAGKERWERMPQSIPGRSER
jgi:hypothetical protein